MVSNSDIDIKDIYFFQKLKNIYSNEQFAVCGPDIYSLSKKFHQNPLRQRYYSKEELNDLIQNYQRKIKILNLIKPLGIYDLAWKIRRKLGLKSNANESINFKKKQYNLVLCGAFFILSKEYYRAYPAGLFDKTFMYLEEDALSIQCERKGLKVIYSPDISVIHFDGVSTLHVNKNRLNKYLFELKNTVDSAKKLKEFISNE